jgi:Phosphodiester glycosidase
MRGRVAILLVLIVAGSPLEADAAELPLGARSLDERRTTVSVLPGLRWTSIVREGGPWRVNVLAVERLSLAGRVEGVLSNERVAGLERPSAMARRTGAAAGVNGGFFAVDGDPVGALAIAGRLLSEPVARRSALVVPLDPGAKPRIAPLTFAGSVVSGRGPTRLLDGIDRRRGRIPACGGRGGDIPTELPNSALTCSDPSELVLLSPSFGTTPPRSGIEALLRGNVVERVGPPAAGLVPAGALVLSGSGDAAAFLSGSLAAGETASVQVRLRAGRRPLAVGNQALVTGGGPRLLRRGRVSVAARPEGFAPLGGPDFFGAFVASRHPRTLAGVKADGTLLLVTVDGRRAGWSAGVTLPEAARVMRSLGARDALNLDGGGSTGMVVRGEVVSRPSDRAGERAVSDGIFVLP